jgi:hypothetical protein
VTAINVTYGGSDYISYPNVTIAPPPTNIVNATLWSNDGTSSGEPSAAVSVAVTSGLFTVVLGDSTQPNMTAIPTALFSQFAYPNLSLQIWFNDGVNSFAALSPVQPLTSVPSATFANTASNLLGTVPTSQLTGPVPAGSLTGSVPAGSLTSVPAASLTGTVQAGVLPADVALTDASSQTFTGRNSFNQGIGVNTTSTLEGDLNINTNTYLFSHIIYLRGGTGTDHNHGLAYCGTGQTNFAATVLPDGPVLWGYGGGVLGSSSGGNHAVLTWNSSNVTVAGTVTANGVLLTSDRNAKQNFMELNSQSVLAKVASLPMTRWNYKTDGKDVQHIGPMAQDFHAAFGLDGADDKHISVVDEGGVALAAIQGLNQKIEEKDAEIQQLQQSVDELKKTVQSLAEKK